MKNFVKLFGKLNRVRSTKVPLLIIAMVAVIGFSMAGCDDNNGGGDVTTLSGTYIKESSTGETIAFFTSNKTFSWTVIDYYDGSSSSIAGTYSITDKTLTLTYSYGYKERWTIINSTTLRDASGEYWRKPSSNSNNGGGNKDRIGETGPGGGIIFYYSPGGFYMTDTGELCHYLERAPSFMEVPARWSTATATPYIIISGTQSGIGAGRRNTALILSLDPTAPAAKICSDYRGGGKDDWFLPSIDELRLLNGLENWYWSSTQSYYTNQAWVYDCDYKNAYESEKNSSSYYVRAIRAF